MMGRGGVDNEEGMVQAKAMAQRIEIVVEMETEG